jgi:hypothetical protein
MPGKQLPRRICSRPFGEDELKIVRNIVGDGQDEGIHRSEIARRVCIALHWRNARGDLKEMGARVALLRLHRQGWIALPEPRNRNGNGSAHRFARAPVPQPPASEIRVSLAQLGAVRLQQVENKADSLLWDGLIDRYHYLGHAPLSGAQIRYLIHADCGVIGAIGFGAAAFALKARDRWIGWDRRQRDRRREWVLNNRRFLILPWIRVANLASHVLSRAAGQVQEDFRTRYGYAPLLLETFVEQDRFTGGCYRAANWIDVGRTAGRGRNDRTSHRERIRHGAPLAIKRIWLYPLRRDARKRLCAPLCQANEIFSSAREVA